MISEHNVQKLIKLPESDHLEKTISTRDTDKFGEAVCAFANDLSGVGLPGYLLIGVEDNGKIDGLRISDEQMRNFSGIRADGNLLPSPTITVAKFSFPEGDVAVLAETDSGNIPNSASLLSAINSNGTINGTINSNIEPGGTINSNIEPSGTINNEIKIKNLIGAHPGIKRAGLSVKTGISVRTIARILKSLKESGAVEYRGSKKSGGWYPKTKLKKYA